MQFPLHADLVCAEDEHGVGAPLIRLGKISKMRSRTLIYRRFLFFSLFETLQLSGSLSIWRKSYQDLYFGTLRDLLESVTISSASSMLIILLLRQ
jgi:hypothetical protein